MGTNESARTKGKCRHGKEISPRMNKDKGHMTYGERKDDKA